MEISWSTEQPDTTLGLALMCDEVLEQTSHQRRLTWRGEGDSQLWAVLPITHGLADCNDQTARFEASAI